LSNTWCKAAFCIFQVLTLGLCVSVGAHAAPSRQERKLVHGAEPVYPELARSNRIKGTVKLRLVVARNGRVKSAEPIGGHPVLIEAALNAIENWKYEATDEETEVIVEFRFGIEEESKK
jgi:TonB family protein